MSIEAGVLCPFLKILFQFFARSSCAIFNTSRALSSSVQQCSGVQLTSERYPNLKRGDYGVLNNDDVAAFQKILDPGIYFNQQVFSKIF